MKPTKDGCAESLALLFVEIAWLASNWELLEKLFGSNPKRIELYNRRTSRIFFVFQTLLWDSTMLGIANLLGPRISEAPHTVSLERAIAELPPTVTSAKRAKLSQQLRKLRTQHKGIIAYRRRRIACRKLKIQTKAQQFDRVTRKHMRQIVDDVDELFKEIHVAYDGTSYGPWPLDVEESQSTELYEIMRHGLAAIEAPKQIKVQIFQTVTGANRSIDDPRDPRNIESLVG